MMLAPRLTGLLDLAQGPLCERGTPVNNPRVEALVTPTGAIRRGRLRLGKNGRITFLREAMFAINTGDGFVPFGKPDLGQETRLSQGSCPVTTLQLGRFTIRQMVTAPSYRRRALPVLLVAFQIKSSSKSRLLIKCPDPIQPWTGAAKFVALDRKRAGRELGFTVASSRPAQAVFALVMGKDESDLAEKLGSISPLPSVTLLA